MVKEFIKALAVATTLAGLIAACAPSAPGISPQQVQSQVETSVALTLQARDQMATAVAASLTAQAPVAAATSSPTAITLNLPTVDPSFATVTPFVVVPSTGGSTGSTAPLYACSWAEIKPKTNQFKPGDAIDVVWIITNTGTKAWPSKKDLDFTSGTKMSSFVGEELPPLKSGDRVTISFDANAPTSPGFYEMRFKVEGGLCFPSLDVEVGKPRDP